MNVDWIQYAAIVRYKAWAELRTESAKTYVGVLWWIIDPILYMAVFWLVFDRLLNRGGEDYVQFLLVGLVFFRWISNSITNAMGSIVGGKGLMQQIYLPKIVFPLVTFYKDTFKFSITLALLLLFLWFTGFSVNEAYWALPLLMIIQVILSLGLLLLVSAVIPLLPDLKFLVNHGTTMLLFLSGVFYSGETLPEEFQHWFYLNPVAALLAGYRDVLMDGTLPQWGRLVNAVIIGVVLLVLALWILTALDRRYPRIVKAR